VRVVVYDSNPLNPYGAELAVVLADAGFSVARWCRVGDPFPDGRIRRHRVLWASRSQVRLPWAVLSRFWGVWVFVLAQTFRRRDIVIMTWLISKQDLLAGLILVAIGRQVIYVDHNPTPARALPCGRERLMNRMRRSEALRVVHTAYLRDQIGDARCLVARHPSYLRWVGRFGARCGSRANQALFLGALRRDKGAQDLPTLTRALSGANVSTVIAGRGLIPGMTLEQMFSCADFVSLGLRRTLSDHEVAEQLRASGVLLAPYRDVTMSGSIMMALSAGVPVAAYPCDALRSTIPGEFFAEQEDPQELARLARKLLDADEVWAERLTDLMRRHDQACAQDWSRVLETMQQRAEFTDPRR